MHHPFLEILAAGFSLALLFGYLAKRMGLSPIVGYLVAGFLVGPQSPGFVADITLARELSEAGVILLMFGVGLHFHLDDLLAVKGISLPGALFQSAVATMCGLAVGLMAGLSLTAGLVMGMALSVASTVVLLRVLTDNNLIDTVHGHVAVGWLVVEDILTVLILVLLPSISLLFAGAGEQGAGLWPMLQALGMAIVRLLLLWLLVLVVGGKVVPFVLTRVVRARSQELFTLTVLVAAFATAMGAAVFFDASTALGAFLGGMVVGRSNLSHQAGADLLPFRDAFAVLFFLSVGMLLEPAFILKQPGLLLGALGIVMLIKPLAAMLIVALLGYSARTGLVAALSLAQVGEFSFILAQQAYALKLVPVEVYNVLVICAIVSISINPGLFKILRGLEAFLKRRNRLWKLLNARADKKLRQTAAQKLHQGPHKHRDPAQTGHAVIVGYGPTGKSVAASLEARGNAVIIIDMNVDTVNNLNENGGHAIYGDAARPGILQAAGVGQAGYLVITLPSLEDTLTITAAATAINGELRVLARARFLQDQEILRVAGANAVISEEKAVADALAETVLEDIRRCEEGACPVYFIDEGLPAYSKNTK